MGMGYWTLVQPTLLLLRLVTLPVCRVHALVYATAIFAWAKEVGRLIVEEPRSGEDEIAHAHPTGKTKAGRTRLEQYVIEGRLVDEEGEVAVGEYVEGPKGSTPILPSH